jgi:hypothetical protein
MPSVIASSMAGRPIVRPADLAFIGTISLYGRRPCQYDRISFPMRSGGGKPVTIRYRYLGRTKGVGTFQFGKQTVHEMAQLLAQSRRGQKVNSVFGEGTSPRLRKIRDGLDELGLPTEELLTHGTPRLVYGVSLIENLREYLLGIERRPKYLVSQRSPGIATREILEWWLRRWVGKRIGREDVLERMARHTLAYPIRHGARVPRWDAEQRMLFET